MSSAACSWGWRPGRGASSPQGPDKARAETATTVACLCSVPVICAGGLKGFVEAGCVLIARQAAARWPLGCSEAKMAGEQPLISTPVSIS